MIGNTKELRMKVRVIKNITFSKKSKKNYMPVFFQLLILCQKLWPCFIGELRFAFYLIQCTLLT